MILFDTNIIRNEVKYFSEVVQGLTLTKEELHNEYIGAIQVAWETFEHDYKDYFDNRLCVVKVVASNVETIEYEVVDCFNKLTRDLLGYDVDFNYEKDNISINELNGNLFIDVDYDNICIRYILKEINSKGQRWYANNWDVPNKKPLEHIYEKYSKRVRLSSHKRK